VTPPPISPSPISYIFFANDGTGVSCLPPPHPSAGVPPKGKFQGMFIRPRTQRPVSPRLRSACPRRKGSPFDRSFCVRAPLTWHRDMDTVDAMRFFRSCDAPRPFFSIEKDTVSRCPATRVNFLLSLVFFFFFPSFFRHRDVPRATGLHWRLFQTTAHLPSFSKCQIFNFFFLHRRNPPPYRSPDGITCFPPSPSSPSRLSLSVLLPTNKNFSFSLTLEGFSCTQQRKSGIPRTGDPPLNLPSSDMRPPVSPFLDMNCCNGLLLGIYGNPFFGHRHSGPFSFPSLLPPKMRLPAQAFSDRFPLCGPLRGSPSRAHSFSSCRHSSMSSLFGLSSFLSKRFPHVSLESS